MPITAHQLPPPFSDFRRRIRCIIGFHAKRIACHDPFNQGQVQLGIECGKGVSNRPWKKNTQ